MAWAAAGAVTWTARVGTAPRVGERARNRVALMAPSPSAARGTGRAHTAVRRTAPMIALTEAVDDDDRGCLEVSSEPPSTPKGFGVNGSR